MIVKREWRTTAVFALAILFLSLAVSVRAHDFSRGAFRRSGVAGRRGPHAGGLLLRLIYPCRGDCFDADRTCDEMAESAAVTCAEQTCDASIQTARTTLLPCIQPCLDTEQSAVASCRTTIQACLTACGSS